MEDGGPQVSLFLQYSGQVLTQAFGNLIYILGQFNWSLHRAKSLFFHQGLPLFILLALNMISNPPSSFGIGAAFVVIAILYYQFKIKASRKLPPGPRGWPIVGNALQLPKDVRVKPILKRQRADDHVLLAACSNILQRASSTIRRFGVSRPIWHSTSAFLIRTHKRG
jgi:hypothetical protein